MAFRNRAAKYIDKGARGNQGSICGKDSYNSGGVYCRGSEDILKGALAVLSVQKETDAVL